MTPYENSQRHRHSDSDTDKPISKSDPVRVRRDGIKFSLGWTAIGMVIGILCSACTVYAFFYNERIVALDTIAYSRTRIVKLEDWRAEIDQDRAKQKERWDWVSGALQNAGFHVPGKVPPP